MRKRDKQIGKPLNPIMARTIWQGMLKNGQKRQHQRIQDSSKTVRTFINWGWIGSVLFFVLVIGFFLVHIILAMLEGRFVL